MYDIHLFDPELILRLCEDMTAHAVRLVRSCREENEYIDALGLVGVEDDCDTAIGNP